MGAGAMGKRVTGRSPTYTMVREKENTFPKDNGHFQQPMIQQTKTCKTRVPRATGMFNDLSVP